MSNTLLRKIVEHLEIKFPVATISRELGYSNGVISEYLNGKKEVSDNFREKFERYYNVSFSDFENKSDAIEKISSVEKTLKHPHELFKPIPFYDLNVSAGDVSFLDSGLLKNQQPDDFMYIPIQVDADIAFPTFGHSMYPEISNGDRVAYKFIKDWSFFNYGMKYLIVTDEQRMVKYLKKHHKKDYVLLESRNEDYEPIDMPIKSIRNILQVRYIGKIEM